MRRFIIQVITNALALTLVLSLFPQIHIDGANILVYLAVGMLFSIVNNVVKPFAIMLLGQWLIRTMGLFMLVINAFMFALLIRFSPFDWVIQKPAWFWIVVASSLLSLLVTLLDALLGLDQPQIDENGKGQFLWSWIDRIPGLYTNKLVENVRLQQVYETIWRYGLDIALAPTPIGLIRNRVAEFISGKPDFLIGESAPAKVRLLLQELGPTYVKFGQIVSSQAEALPEEWATELARLQNTVPPFPYETAREIIEKELGAPPNELYLNFEETPFAAASTAQVHRATLPTGESVVVKVQRPNIVAKVNADVGVMTKLARVLERRSTAARQLNLRGMLEEFGKGLVNELNYQNEAYFARRMASNMLSIENVHVPVVYSQRSTKRVLTMEFISGVKITNVAALDAAGTDRHAAARTFIRAIVKQVLIDGFFHGDPHPGNIMIDPKTGIITFLDLGMVGNLQQAQRFDILDLLWAINQGDVHGLATVVMRLTKHSRPVDVQDFRMDLERAYFQYGSDASGNSTFAEMMNAVLDVLANYGMRLDQDLTLAIKAITQAEVIATTLNPQILWSQIAFEEATNLLGERFTPEHIYDSMKTQVVRSAKEMLREIPSLQDATLKWLNQYRRGRFVVELDTSELSKSVEHFSISTRRVTVALILVGMIIGSAIATSLLSSMQGTQWEILPILAMLVFLGTTAFGIWVVIRMISTENL